MPHSQPGVTTHLLARKQQSMKKVESWDDDFGDLEDDFLPRESVLHASVSSAGSFVRPRDLDDEDDDEDEEEDQFGNAFAQQKAQGAKFLTAFREDGADLGFNDESNLTTKMSSFNLQRNMRKSVDYGDGDDEAEYNTIRKRPSTLRVRSTTGSPVKYGTVKRSQQEIREAFRHLDLGDDGDDDGDDTQEVKTLRARKPSKAAISVSQGALFNPPQSKSRSKSPTKAPTKHSNRRLVIKEPEDFEDGFDIDAPGDLASRLQKVKHQLHVDQEEDFDSWGEESSRATSRMSETSVSSVMSSSYEESEADDGEAFLDGLELPEKHVNFQEILETRQRDAQYVADHEDELMMQGKKYDTIRSNGSGNSLKTLEMLNGNEDEVDLDFFDGIDVKDEAFAHQKEKTMHRNVVVKGKKRNSSLSSDKKKSSMLKMKQSMPQLREEKRDTSPTKRPATTKLARIGENSLGEVSPTKKRIPSAQLRSVQSMSNFSAHRTPSARPKYTRGRATKVFGDGTELDKLGDLPTNMDTEHSFTVTPKASRVRTIKHKPLDTFREKPSKVESKPTKSSLSSKKSSAHLTKRRSKESKKKGPGLIQQLGPPKTSIISKGYNGDMRFNPRKLIWEGNDIELKKFESVNPKGPGLIAFISNKGVQVVGDMVFDPDKMCWIRVGNTDEADPFEGMEDLDVSVRSRVGGGAGESVLRPSASMHTSMHGEFQVGKEFDITNDMLKRMQHEDERWQRKCGHWFSPDETFDRDYLNEIRQMVMK